MGIYHHGDLIYKESVKGRRKFIFLFVCLFPPNQLMVSWWFGSRVVWDSNRGTPFIKLPFIRGSFRNPNHCVPNHQLTISLPKKIWVRIRERGEICVLFGSWMSHLLQVCFFTVPKNRACLKGTSTRGHCRVVLLKCFFCCKIHDIIIFFPWYWGWWFQRLFSFSSLIFAKMIYFDDYLFQVAGENHQQQVCGVKNPSKSASP